MVSLDQINEKRARVSVIGLGYVGLPLSVSVAEAGINTIGIDNNQALVNRLNKGGETANGISATKLDHLKKDDRLTFTSDYSALESSDITVISVPTPLNQYRGPDMSHIRESLKGISPYLERGNLVIVESTLYPRATEDEVGPLLEQETGLTPGEDFYLVFSPERIDPGNKEYTLIDVPKVVGSISKKGGRLAEEFYRTVLDSEVHTVSSPRVAEMEKLLENIYRNVNIALVNELDTICEEMDIDIWETIEAASTKPYGFQPFYPGPGVGGHCIPVDPFFVNWKAKEEDSGARFIELAGQINRNRPRYVVSKLMDLLNEREKSLKGSKVLLLGMAYKKDIGDTRNSPGLKIAEILIEKGAEVKYNDPYVEEVDIGREEVSLTSVNLDLNLLKTVDSVVIVTDHSDYDYDWLVENSGLILDTRNATAGLDGPKGGEVVRI
ncbi:nucleotide sugar dehydrogenase [Candidatus Bipolaricaulota bacterium]|nr:nucleotide sugar dehydrogenase [Candidatus Bipolaricaulota bacterium]